MKETLNRRNQANIAKSEHLHGIRSQLIKIAARNRHLLLPVELRDVGIVKRHPQHAMLPRAAIGIVKMVFSVVMTGRWPALLMADNIAVSPSTCA